jgi:antitoxin component YwqK of YwqJK toxin-antitoxin module
MEFIVIAVLFLLYIWYKSDQKKSDQKKSDYNHKGGKLYVKTEWHEENQRGQKWRESHFKDEKLHGKQTYWYQNGQKEREIYFKDGKLHGKQNYWYKNGKKWKEDDFVDYTLYNEHDIRSHQKMVDSCEADEVNPVSFDFLFEALDDKTPFIGHENCCQIRGGLIYLPNQSKPFSGTLGSIGHFQSNVKDGKLHGKRTYRYQNGQKEREEYYKNGQLHGKQTYWYKRPEGRKDIERYFKDGKLHGKRTYWYRNGQKEREGDFEDGKLHGKQTYWQENGEKAVSKAFQGDWWGKMRRREQDYEGRMKNIPIPVRLRRSEYDEYLH